MKLLSRSHTANEQKTRADSAASSPETDRSRSGLARIRLALGGAICGGFLGSFAGALFGVLYGTWAGDLSLGLDGALLGSLIAALLGAVYGLACAVKWQP